MTQSQIDKKILFWNLSSFLLLCLFLPTSALAKIYFYDGFEEGTLDFSKWHYSGTKLGRVVKAGADGPPNARQGRYCTQHTVFPPKYRDEIVPNNDLKKFYYDKEYWIGASYYLPDGPHINHAYVILQVHASNPGLCECLGEKNPSGSNLIALTEPKPGHLRLSIKTKQQQKKGVCEHFPIFVENVWESKSGNRNKWHDFVFHFKPHESKGFMEVFYKLASEKNYRKIHSHQGATAELFDGCGRPIPLSERYYYFKTGSYARYMQGQPQGKQTKVFVDEIRFGDANSSLSEVAPGGGGTVIEPDTEDSTPPKKPSNVKIK